MGSPPGKLVGHREKLNCRAVHVTTIMFELGRAHRSVSMTAWLPNLFKLCLGQTMTAWLPTLFGLGLAMLAQNSTASWARA